jgi:hypothetical protein
MGTNVRHAHSAPTNLVTQSDPEGVVAKGSAHRAATVTAIHIDAIVTSTPTCPHGLIIVYAR